MRTPLAILAAVVLIVTACGDSDDDGAADTTAAAPTTVETTAPTTTAPATTAPTTTAPATTAPATTAPATTAPGTTAPATTAPAGGGEMVAVEMREWIVDTSDRLAAGPTTFTITNAGEFNHEFVVVRGTAYDDLPQLGNGAVDEATLGDDVIGRSDVIDPGASATLDLDLTAGDYVFLCNINVGPNSHVAQGQVLSVTVG